MSLFYKKKLLFLTPSVLQFMRRCYLNLWGYFLSYENNDFSVGFTKKERLLYPKSFLVYCLLSAVNINCYRALKLSTCWFLIFDIFFVTWSRGVVCSNNIILTYLVLDCFQQAWPCELPLNFDTGEHIMWQRLHWHTALHLSLSFQSLF